MSVDNEAFDQSSIVASPSRVSNASDHVTKDYNNIYILQFHFFHSQGTHFQCCLI